MLNLRSVDQIALETDSSVRSSEVERARSAWTWCYLYDRTIDKCQSHLNPPASASVVFQYESESDIADGQVRLVQEHDNRVAAPVHSQDGFLAVDSWL